MVDPLVPLTVGFARCIWNYFDSNRSTVQSRETRGVAIDEKATFAYFSIATQSVNREAAGFNVHRNFNCRQIFESFRGRWR